MNTYLGIDVSKGYADFSLLDTKKNMVEKSFQLDDTRKGHDALEELLKQWIAEHKISAMYCAVESTGGFENNWYAWLMKLSSKLPLKVARLNPSGVKNNIAAGLERNITDALSSRYIAEYLISHSDKVNYEVQSIRYATYRSLHNHILLEKKQNTQLINELKMVLYSAFPELMCYCKQGVPQWVLEILQKYGSVGAVAKLNMKQLTKIDYVTEERAQAILTKAASSTASRTEPAQEFLIKKLAREIAGKQQLIDESKKFLADTCKGEEVTLLESICGVGSYSAAAIMIEIEDIKRFPSPAHLASYFGLHPELKQSGDKQFAYRMSKKGRPSMRSTLYMCAQAAVLHDDHLKAIYHRHRNNGKTHKAAVGVIMHKILRIIWGMLTKNEVYNPAIDKKNQEKKAVPQNAENVINELKIKRRYQGLEEGAPISNRQNKKRKMLLESQVSEAEQMRDHQIASA